MKKRNIGRFFAIMLISILIVGIQSSTILFQDEFFFDDDAPLGIFITAKEAGMIPNDESQARKNGDLFIKALNKYGGIIIDDAYYIGTPSEKLTTRNIEITGTENGELISEVNASTRLLNPEDIDNLTIEGTKFTNYNEVGSFLIVYNPAPSKNRVENVLVENCIFQGNISLFRQYGDTTLDPDITDYGIENFTFNNNQVFDIGLSFIVLKDIPVTYCEVSNNDIHNFNFVFLNIAISNGIPFEQKLYEHIEYLEVDTNRVISEDDWWGKTDSGPYYTFVLFEGTEVLYNNNYVEGMKALEDIALYDAYLSAEVVNYTNNTWKNNICFAADKTNNTLLKSKGGGEKPLIRNYSNNTFIVEEDFAERMGQSKEGLKVDFISLTRYAESYIIDNNIFDVYDLRFPKSSSRVSNYVFTGNTVKVTKSSGYLVILRLNDDYSTNKIEIINNNISIYEIADANFVLVASVDNRKISTDIIENIIINNNKITAPFGFLFFRLRANNLELKDNEITDIANKNSRLAYNSEFINSKVLDNIIEGNNSLSRFENTSLAGIENKAENK